MGTDPYFEAVQTLLTMNLGNSFPQPEQAKQSNYIYVTFGKCHTLSPFLFS